MKTLPIPWGDLRTRTRCSPSAEQGTTQVLHPTSTHRQEGEFNASAVAGSRVSLHLGWHMGDLHCKHEDYTLISILAEQLSFRVCYWTSLDPSTVVGTVWGGWHIVEWLQGETGNCISWLLPVQVKAWQYTQLQTLQLYTVILHWKK